MELVLKSATDIKSHQDKGALLRLFREVRKFFRTDEEFREFLKMIDRDNSTPMKDCDNSPQETLKVRSTEFDDAHDVLSVPKTKTGKPQTKPKKQMKDPV